MSAPTASTQTEQPPPLFAAAFLVVLFWLCGLWSGEALANLPSAISSIHADNDLAFISGGDQHHQGTEAKAGNNLTVDAGGKVLIESAQNTSEHKDKSTNGSVNVGLSTGSGVSVTAAGGYARNSNEQTEQVNAHFEAGKQVSLTTAGDTTLAGATVTGDSIDAHIGGNLTVESRQDTGSIRGESAQGSVTVSVSGGGSGLSLAGSHTKGDSAWVEEQSGLFATGKNNVYVEKHTSLIGGVINSDSGDTHLDTGSLSYEDIHDYDHFKSVSASVGIGTSQSNGGAPADTANEESQSGAKMNSVQAGYEKREREQITRATVGAGTITVRDDAANGTDSTQGLNRDIDRAQQITKDIDHSTNLYASDTSINTLADAHNRAEFFDLKKTVRDVSASSAGGLDEIDNALTAGFSLGQSSSEGMISSTQANAMRQDAGKWGEDAFDALGAIPQYLAQLPPSGEADGVAGKIGKVFDVLGTGGLLPSKANNGGVLAELPLLLGASDINQKSYVLVPQDEAAQFGDYIPVTELPGYADLPAESKALLNGQVMIQIEPGQVSTYQNFTNGMLNDLPQALVNGMQQTGSNLLTVNYNPTHGLLGDGLEIALDKLSGQFGFFHSSDADYTGQALLKTSISQFEKGAGTNLVNHSQGNILYQVGLLTLDATDFQYLNDKSTRGLYAPTTVSYGSPVNIEQMNDALSRLGFPGEDSYVNPGDYVGEGFGYNSDHNKSLLPGWSAIENIKKLPILFYGSKYPDQGKEVSPHSTYHCEIHCGRDGTGRPGGVNE